MKLRQLYLGTSRCWGHSVLQTPAIVLFVCRMRLISYETFSGVTWVKHLEKITRKSFVRGISSMYSSILSQNMTKPLKLPVRATKTQISLASAQSDQSSLTLGWNIRSLATCTPWAHSEDCAHWAQTDLSMSSFCWWFCAAAHMMTQLIIIWMPSILLFRKIMNKKVSWFI